MTMLKTMIMVMMMALSGVSYIQIIDDDGDVMR